MNIFSATSLTGLLALGMVVASTEVCTAAEPTKIYELRTYTVLPGRMPAMLKRFRDHTTRLFEKHGMQNIGYWTPAGPEAETKLIYVLAHDSQTAAEKNWQAFKDDPDWQAAREESERDGKIVEKSESVYLTPTDFSKLK